MTHSAIRHLEEPVFHLIFWGWNSLFATLVYIGVLPFLLTDWGEFRHFADMPTNFQIFFAIMVVTPGAAITAALLKLRSDPRRLIRFFYGVEAPLLLIATARVILFRELTGTTTLLFVGLVVATAANAVLLLFGPKRMSRALLFGQTIGLVLAVYIALVLSFFVLPTVSHIVEVLLDGSFFRGVARAFTRSGIAPLFAILVAGASATLFVALPFAFIACHYTAFRELLRAALAEGRTNGAALAVAASVATMAVAGFAVHVSAPTGPATLELLESPPADRAERQRRLDDANGIHADLLDAYLWRYRYVTPAGESRAIVSLYEETMPGFLKGAFPDIQRAFDDLVSPFLYDGARGDEERAQAHYASFFDESIQRGARSTIKTAIEATFERVDVAANLLDVGERAVHVVSQTITVDEDDFAADIEVFDVYENKTNIDVEILYYFSLPDTAVLTGLWLNERAPNKADAFRFRVSPRGAAQRVYEREVRRRVDPALLEQIGPNQYRLRVFPIPARRDEPRRMHLWMRYRAVPDGEGWPLPRLIEARNVFWDERTVRTVDGDEVDGSTTWSDTHIVKPTPPPSRRAFAIGGRRIVAEPIDDASMPRGGRNYAVVLDRSYSMNEVAGEVATTFDWLRANVYPRSNVDLFLTSAIARGAPAERVDDAPSYDPRSEQFYGGQSTASMLRQAIALAEDADISCPSGRTGIDCYDAVIFLTDRGRIEMESDDDVPYSGATPLWMIHLGGTLAAGYDDAVTDALLVSAGGVATDIEAPFRSFALAERHPGAFIGFSGGYAWTIEDGPAERVDPLAARQFVRAAIQTQDVSKRDVLDRIHRVATSHEIVTPYSSMIVLVMDRQHEALDEAEKEDDRFDRKTSNEEERLAHPKDKLGLTGTPEPEEWLLLILGALMLLAFARERLKLGSLRAELSQRWTDW